MQSHFGRLLVEPELDVAQWSRERPQMGSRRRGRGREEAPPPPPPPPPRPMRFAVKLREPGLGEGDAAGGCDGDEGAGDEAAVDEAVDALLDDVAAAAAGLSGATQPCDGPAEACGAEVQSRLKED
jgi:hypothetical protein